MIYAQHSLDHGQAEKLSSSFTLNSDEQSFYRSSTCTVLICLVKNPLLFLLSLESPIGSVEGSGGKQITP